MFETVIFLDVDGVLNCETSKSYVITEEGKVLTGIDKDKVKRLASIVAATGADIVLISSWRNGWYTSDGFLFGSTTLSNHAKYLRNHLYKKGKLFIRDKTPNSPRGRGYEIKFWLKTHPQTKAWVVLDDEEWHDFYEYDEILRHRVKTDYNVGLTDEDATAAIQILKGQLLGPIEAQGVADAKLIQADAEAESNKKIAESLTPQLIELRRVEAEHQKAESIGNWRPSVIGGNSMPMIDMNNIATEGE